MTVPSVSNYVEICRFEGRRRNARTAMVKRELLEQIALLQAQLETLHVVEKERDYWKNLYEESEASWKQKLSKMEAEFDEFKAAARREKNKLYDEMKAGNEGKRHGA